MLDDATTLHPRFRKPSVLAALRDAWTETRCLRIEQVLAPGLATTLADAALRRGFDLLENHDLDFRCLFFRTWVPYPEPGAPSDFAPIEAARQLMMRDVPALATAITGREMARPPVDGLIFDVYRKGSYLDEHTDQGPERLVAYVLGLTRDVWPADRGGHLEFLTADATAVIEQPPARLRHPRPVRHVPDHALAPDPGPAGPRRAAHLERLAHRPAARPVGAAVIQPRLLRPGSLEPLRAAWRQHGAVRIEHALVEAVTAGALEVLKTQAHVPIVHPDADQGFQLWRFAWRPEAACDHLLCQLGRWLAADGRDLVADLAGTPLELAGGGVLVSDRNAKGSFAEPWSEGGTVAFQLGLTPASWPAGWGGHHERLDADGVVELSRAPSWNTLDLWDLRRGRVFRRPLLLRHVAGFTVSGAYATP